MKVYGLTGGIGSGKSTVARMLRDLGASTIDADEVARAVVRPGTDGLARLVAAFGDSILDSTGALDRKRLAAVVFGDDAARARLNAVIHPLIAQETTRRITELRDRGVSLVFYEAALLVENGAYRAFDGLIVVEAEAWHQRERVAARDGLSASEIDARMAAQLSSASRREAADLVLKNDGTLDELSERVHKLFSGLSDGRSLAEVAATL